jgi:hypothetical protein
MTSIAPRVVIDAAKPRVADNKKLGLGVVEEISVRRGRSLP